MDDEITRLSEQENENKELIKEKDLALEQFQQKLTQLNLRISELNISNETSQGKLIDNESQFEILTQKITTLKNGITNLNNELSASRDETKEQVQKTMALQSTIRDKDEEIRKEQDAH